MLMMLNLTHYDYYCLQVHSNNAQFSPPYELLEFMNLNDVSGTFIRQNKASSFYVLSRCIWNSSTLDRTMCSEYYFIHM